MIVINRDVIHPKPYFKITVGFEFIGKYINDEDEYHKIYFTTNTESDKKSMDLFENLYKEILMISNNDTNTNHLNQVYDFIAYNPTSIDQHSKDHLLSDLHKMMYIDFEKKAVFLWLF